MLEMLTAESFEPLVGTDFAVSVGALDEVLTLVDVARGKRATTDDHRYPFILVFHGARADICFRPQILALRHSTLGTIEIDVAPFNRLPAGNYAYQAGFN